MGTLVEGNTMTETEWLAAAEPEPMLDYLRGRATARKRRLFAVACCRSVWHLLTDERSRRAVELAERYADGLADEEDLRRAAAGAETVAEALAAYAGPTDRNAESSAAFAALNATRADGNVASYVAANAASAAYHEGAIDAEDEDLTTALARRPGAAASRARERTEQADILRELFGNPFKPVTVDRAWLLWNGGTVSALATKVYAENAFDRLPLLADSLEDAGCWETNLLGHLRGPGAHARGCWALDLILAKN
jgi:hypothetical protein